MRNEFLKVIRALKLQHKIIAEFMSYKSFLHFFCMLLSLRIITLFRKYILCNSEQLEIRAFIYIRIFSIWEHEPS